LIWKAKKESKHDGTKEIPLFGRDRNRPQPHPIGRSRGTLGSCSLERPLHSGGDTEQAFSVPIKNNVDKALFLEFFPARLGIFFPVDFAARELSGQETCVAPVSPITMTNQRIMEG